MRGKWREKERDRDREKEKGRGAEYNTTIGLQLLLFFVGFFLRLCHSKDLVYALFAFNLFCSLQRYRMPKPDMGTLCLKFVWFVEIRN